MSGKKSFKFLMFLRSLLQLSMARKNMKVVLLKNN